ncbi:MULTISPECIES: TetR/AcrR family transcriptional regulator [Paenibacillus]|uniref:TetR family transcriptional regulator n=1 Tax=Paenibacillus albilobatus TaxID=2716884 RepID=A0A920CC34_9BACL|nr:MULTISPECIES: TetR/AcrR family transcriptional regulator [Paenibacillus]MDR9857046.1 TetR/AcrR family transcriptional regulator [Paenibacillus sp. VCA1]GIO34256.1 TetR family transcriptional regulator [Paenibacillus albilobatus]
MKKRELTSKQLIEAAVGLFAHHGIEKTSLAMIAAEVGITKPSIYYHFASKDELVEKVFDYLFSDYRFDFYFSVSDFNEQNFAEKLFQGGLRMFPEDEGSFYPVLRLLHEFMLTAGHGAHYGERVIGMQRDFLEGFRKLLLHGAKLGLIEQEHVESRAYLLALAIDNMTSYMMMGIKLDYENIWKEAVNGTFRKGGNVI